MENKPLNNPIWVMSSAFDQLNLDQLIKKTIEVGAQGIDLCVFRKIPISDCSEVIRRYSDFELYYYFGRLGCISC